jgi:methionine-S-sulfoxide reductase
MTNIATLGGGCYWCLDALYRRVKGVSKVESGYSGGHTEHPTMADVYGGATGHAEVVQITFDPEVITYREILEIFFVMHDPTTLNRQGNDVGDEYRSVIFYHDDEQREIAEDMLEHYRRRPAGFLQQKSYCRLLPGDHQSQSPKAAPEIRITFQRSSIARREAPFRLDRPFRQERLYEPSACTPESLSLTERGFSGNAFRKQQARKSGGSKARRALPE